MGRALAASPDASDKALFADWYRFTKELATLSSFSANAQERQMARSFVTHALEMEKRSTDVFASPEECAHALDALTPSPDHMFWFEYNFLFVLAADGRAEKAALGDHGRAGYRQRARFYAVSPAGRLGYAKNVADYLCFLAETTGQAPSEACARAKKKLAAYSSYDALVADIAPS
jgi:hypothetical protein